MQISTAHSISPSLLVVRDFSLSNNWPCPIHFIFCHCCCALCMILTGRGNSSDTSTVQLSQQPLCRHSRQHQRSIIAVLLIIHHVFKSLSFEAFHQCLVPGSLGTDADALVPILLNHFLQVLLSIRRRPSFYASSCCCLVPSV